MTNVLEQGFLLHDKQYLIKKCIGQGTLGVTYLAEHVNSGFEIIVKEFFPSFCVMRKKNFLGIEPLPKYRFGYRDYLQKWLQEARMWRNIKHDNVISIHEVFEELGTGYFVMDYLKGKNLKKLLEEQNNRCFEFEVAETIMEKVVQALTSIHEKDVYHSDLCAKNIFVENTGRVVLFDFGVTRWHLDSQKKLIYNHAPEMIQGIIDQRCDVYGAAVLFFELLTGLTYDKEHKNFLDFKPFYIKKLIEKGTANLFERSNSIVEWWKQKDSFKLQENIEKEIIKEDINTNKEQKNFKEDESQNINIKKEDCEEKIIAEEIAFEIKEREKQTFNYKNIQLKKEAENKTEKCLLSYEAMNFKERGYVIVDRQGYGDFKTLKEGIENALNGKIYLTEGSFFIDNAIKIKQNLIIDGSTTQKTSVLLENKVNNKEDFFLECSNNIMLNINNISFSYASFSEKKLIKEAKPKSLIKLNDSKLVLKNSRFYGDKQSNAIFADKKSEIQIEDSFFNGFFTAIYLTGKTKAVLINNVLQNNLESAIFLEQTSTAVIENNIITNNQKNAISVYNEAYCSVINNKLSDNVGSGIKIKSKNKTTFFIIKNNEIIMNGEHGIKAFLLENIVCEKNFLLRNKKNGLFLENCQKIIIKENEINNNYQNGVIIKNCADILVEKNKISYSSNNGLQITESSLENVIENEIFKNRKNAVLLSQNQKCHLVKNIITDNGRQGVLCLNLKTGLIKENDIKENSKSGLVFAGDNENMRLEDNKISSNLFGCRVSGKGDFKFKKNSFSKNNNDGMLINGNVAIFLEKNIYYNNDESGLLVYNSNKLKIIESHFKNNSSRGVSLAGDFETNIIKCNFERNLASGLSLEKKSIGFINDSFFEHNKKDGIVLYDQCKIEIYSCKISKNRNGIMLSDKAKMTLKESIIENSENSGLVCMQQAYGSVCSTKFINNLQCGIVLSEETGLVISNDNIIKGNKKILNKKKSFWKRYWL